MEEERDYKYKLEKAEDIIEVRRVYGDTSRKNMEVLRNNRKGIFKPTLNVRAKNIDIAPGKKTACEYGEFIAHKMLEKMEIKSCDVEMVKRYITNSRSKSGRGNEIPGVISYIDLKPEESLVSAISIISWFKYQHRDEFNKIVNPLGLYDKDDYKVSPENEKHNNNIELIIPSFMAYVKEKCGGTEKQAREIRQRIIEMVTFDCRNANRDRHDENYGLAVEKDGVRFYPLYDNEYILGFSEPTDDIEKYSAARLQEHLNKDLYSVMGVSSQPTKISSSAMMTYLFSTYPLETQKAYKKVMKFKTDDLLELMEECEGLPEQHKAYSARIFRLRGREIEGIQEEYIDQNGKPIKQEYLPGNKHMELVRGTGSSGSRTTKEVKPSKTSKTNEKELSLDD